jgi:hypothetical protein
VTELEYELQPFGPVLSTGYAFYDEQNAVPALRAFRDHMHEAPDELYLLASVTVGSERWPVPSSHHGRPLVGLSWGWVGDHPEDGAARANALHRVGVPISESVDTLTYVEIQSGKFGLDQPPRRAYWKSSLFRDLTDAALDALWGSTVEVNAGRPIANAELLSMGGAIARVGDADSAYGNRDALVDFIAAYYWENPAEDAERIQAMRTIWATVSEHGASGVYFNNLGEEQPASEAYGQSKYQRLAAIKRRYDPDNVFRHTANIRPES